MNRGLLVKTFREVWPLTLVFGLALGTLEMLLSFVLPGFADENIGAMLQMRFVQTILKGLLGTDVGPTLAPNAMAAMMWVHPVALALIWANEITICTRLPAGEVDRGTIDVWLSLPVSRTTIFISQGIGWLVSGLAVLGMGLAGHYLGSRFAPPEFVVSFEKLSAILVNLFCLYMAVGGVACLVSSLASRRGLAVGVILGIILASFAWSFLAQFWKIAEQTSFLSLMHYYRPMALLDQSTWPAGDMLTLAAVGAVTWILGAVFFSLRDIRTV